MTAAIFITLPPCGHDEPKPVQIVAFTYYGGGQSEQRISLTARQAEALAGLLAAAK